MMEDTLALIGSLPAGLGIGCSMLTGDEPYDTIGGLMVGLVPGDRPAALAFKLVLCCSARMWIRVRTSCFRRR